MWTLEIGIFLCGITITLVIVRELVKKNAYIWLPGYLINNIKLKNKRSPVGTVHIVFAIVDHFEPLWSNTSDEQELSRMDAWMKGYPETVRGHADADGRCPQHTWFYPFDEYRSWHLEKLTKLCSLGYGEIELHLHHDNDTSEGLRQKIQEARQIFSKHGALIHPPSPSHSPTLSPPHSPTSPLPHSHTYAFIHGNWSLDNSRRDGRWCGVNNELQILAETGCYADFTMPSAPSETKSRKINSIYYAIDDPDRPKSYNTGIDVEVNREPSGDLMMIQGPLCLNWGRRKLFILPTIENGNITADNPPTPDRVDLWIKQHIHVVGRPDWVFVKVYTHGAQDRNIAAFLGPGGYLGNLYSYLESAYNDGSRYSLHYATAREMYNIIKAAEAGEMGNPGSYRDYLIPTYANRLRYEDGNPPF